MKKAFVFLVFVLVITGIIGCSNDKQGDFDVTEVRKSAWNSLSDKDKEEVIGEWKSAEVVEMSLNDLPLVKNGGESPDLKHLYKTTFETNRDEMLGPIVVYVNGESNEIIGYGARK
ncbi:hypothetical protein [Paenibacillus sp. BC26]|uniref:hypothetical protein n=1 Tax=Paenibacillus sp. BC26 TaxID=1881032 RepID=UPI0008F44D55|nr:hypothetical protein [Paenibacillus sp. BC26]SFS75902.1 hypothetical protein SAMN05428962_2683 [Paenibacillus sp. BC26]